MEIVDLLAIAEKISEVNSAYNALISLLAWNTKELTESERYGVYMINNVIFDELKSVINDINRLRKNVGVHAVAE